MKRFVIGAMVAALALFALRRFGPAVRGWAEAKCNEMMANRRTDATADFTDADVASVTAPSEAAVAPGRG